MQDNRDISYLTEMQPLVRHYLESALRKGDAINSTFESWKTFLFARFVFDSAKEIRESFMHSVRYILSNLRMNRIFAFYQFVIVKLPKSFLGFFVSIYGRFKKLVIDYLANFQRSYYLNLLFLGRIQTIFIHQQAHRGSYYV
jgi:hypothetical protein